MRSSRERARSRPGVLRTGSSVALMATIVVALTAAGCGRGSPPAESLLLVTLDTTRADALGCAGNMRAETPNLDHLAATGVRFTHALSLVPITLPAHSSIFTGMTPPHHGVHDNYTHRLGDDAETLTEILAGEGVATAAFVSSFVLDRRFGLAQGFATYDDDMSGSVRDTYGAERAGAVTVDRALAWLRDNRDRRFFLWVHLYEPHDPYEPPEPWASRLDGDPYLAEVAAADAAVGRLLKALDELDLAGSTAVAVAGDHGEMLGEHGESTHTYFVYQAALEVPWIMRVPGGPAGVVIERRSSLVDIAPTLCELLGARVPAGVEGRSLAAALTEGGPAPPAAPITVESLTPTRYGANPLLGLVDGGFKLIDTTRPELYDLVADPGEIDDLAARQPDRLTSMTRQLSSLRATAAGPAVDPLDLDPDAAARLAALGYAAAPVTATGIEPERDDPKDLIAFHEAHHRVIDLVASDRFAEAEPICRRLASERPGFWENAVNLAKVLVGQQRWAEAVPALERALELAPGRSDMLYGLGVAHTALGELDAATRAFSAAVEHDPEPPRALLNLARALLNQGRVDEAGPVLDRAVPMAEDGRPGLLVEAARLRAGSGELEAAAEHLARARELGVDPQQTDLLLADLRLRQHRDADAVAALESLVTSAPDRSGAVGRATELLATHGRYDLAAPLLAAVGAGDDASRHRLLGLVHLGRGELDAARAELEAALRLAPDDTAARNALGLALARGGDMAGARREFERVLEIDSASAGGRLNLGMVALATGGGVDRAAEHFEAATRLDPELAQAWLNLGLARLRQGRPTEAVTVLERARRLDPDNPSLLDQLAWLRLDPAEPSLRDPDVAVELAEHACRLTGRRDPRLLATLAVAHAAVGDRAAAQSVAVEARSAARRTGDADLVTAVERDLGSIYTTGP